MQTDESNIQSTMSAMTANELEQVYARCQETNMEGTLDNFTNPLEIFPDTIPKSKKRKYNTTNLNGCKDLQTSIVCPLKFQRPCLSYSPTLNPLEIRMKLTKTTSSEASTVVVASCVHDQVVPLCDISAINTDAEEIQNINVADDIIGDFDINTLSQTDLSIHLDQIKSLDCLSCIEDYDNFDLDEFCERDVLSQLSTFYTALQASQ